MTKVCENEIVESLVVAFSSFTLDTLQQMFWIFNFRYISRRTLKENQKKNANSTLLPWFTVYRHVSRTRNAQCSKKSRLLLANCTTIETSQDEQLATDQFNLSKAKLKFEDFRRISTNSNLIVVFEKKSRSVPLQHSLDLNSYWPLYGFE